MKMIRIGPAFTLLCVLAAGVAATGHAAAAAPPAPTSLSPADGANVTVPFTISWASVSDPSGILGYNWQVSSSSSFTIVVLQNSTNGLTQDTVSGLPNGTYFWRVDAVNNAFVTGAWSPGQSFIVTAAGPGEPGSPTLAPTQAYSTFHPFESITFNWTAVPGAATYVLQAATDPNFPIVTRIQFDNIPNTTMTFEIGNPEGSYFARVIAVNSNGIAGVPSNVITFSVFFNNPIGPAPVLSSPATGTALTLPVTLTWADVPNPQPSGYELQIARDAGFASIEEDDPQLNGPSRTVLSLTSGTKFWRVRSAQGDNSPTTSAETAFSAARSFTIPSAPPTPVSVTVVSNPLYSGNTSWVAVQLTSAVAATGATVNLSSSNSTAAPVPATVAMPGNTAWTQFQMTTGQVTSPTVVTLTATLNSASAAVQFTLLPPSLNSLIIAPGTISGGAQPEAIVMLNGLAPAGGAVVNLSSDSPAVQPPAVANVAPGSASASLAIPTSTVTANTTATLTATWNGVSAQSHVTLTAQQPPTSITLSPASTVGQSGGSFATVSIASPAPTDDSLQVTVDNPSVATMVPNSVTIPAGNTTGGFNIFTTAVTTTTVVTISVSGGGVTQSATLTVTPAAPPPATLSAITLSPSTVAGGATSQGTATLASAAPSGGAVVTLTSSNTARATVPASVMVAAGATSAAFTVTTATAAASTSATIGGASGGVSRNAVLTISKTPAAAALSSIAVSPASVTGGTASQGTVTLTSAAPSGGAVVTLTSSNTAAATVPASVTVAAGATKATFTVSTVSVVSSTSATIGGTFAGVSRTAVLTVTPPPPPASLSSAAVSPASVTGGTSSQGTVTLTSAAPSGGFTATLSSNNPAAAVPASVTVVQGATSATFAIATSSVTASTPVTITASAGGVTRTATLTVTPPGQSATLTVTATGRSGERVTSNPAGINVAVGSTMPASFTTGTSITLTVSNGRNAAWSGACTNGGSKTCTFTLTGNATVTANVQ